VIVRVVGVVLCFVEVRESQGLQHTAVASSVPRIQPDAIERSVLTLREARCFK
jgi:hypothetical protein